MPPVSAAAPRVQQKITKRRSRNNDDGNIARWRLALNVSGILVVLTLWEIFARVGVVNDLLMGSPLGIARAGLDQLTDLTVWQHFGHSASAFGLGILLAAVVGVTIGLAAGWWRRADYLIDPWLTILYSTPMVALVPLIVVVIGIDLSAKVFIVFLFAIFPIAINTTTGVHATSERYLRVSRNFRASQFFTIRTVVIPGASPFIMTGIRLAGGRAIVGVVVAELLTANQGIGYLLNISGSTFQTNKLMFLLLMLGLAGVLYGSIIGSIEKRLSKWRADARR